MLGASESGAGLVSRPAEGSKEGRLAALGRYETRWARQGEQPLCRRPATLPSVTVDEQQNRFAHPSQSIRADLNALRLLRESWRTGFPSSRMLQSCYNQYSLFAIMKNLLSRRSLEICRVPRLTYEKSARMFWRTFQAPEWSLIRMIRLRGLLKFQEIPWNILHSRWLSQFAKKRAVNLLLNANRDVLACLWRQIDHPSWADVCAAGRGRGGNSCWRCRRLISMH